MLKVSIPLTISVYNDANCVYWELNAGNIQSILISLSSLFFPFFSHSVPTFSSDFSVRFFFLFRSSSTLMLFRILVLECSGNYGRKRIETERESSKASEWHQNWTPNGKTEMLFQFIFGVSALSCAILNRRLKRTQRTVGASKQAKRTNEQKKRLLPFIFLFLWL